MDKTVKLLSNCQQHFRRKNILERKGVTKNQFKLLRNTKIAGNRKIQEFEKDHVTRELNRNGSQCGRTKKVKRRECDR